MLKIKNKEKFIHGLVNGKYTIKNASSTLKKDREVLLLCSKCDLENPILAKVPKQLFKDKEFLTQVIINNPKNFVCLNKSTQADKQFILSLCEKNSDVINFIPKQFKQDEDFLKSLVSVNGLAIKGIDNQFIEDREINYLAIKNNALAFKFMLSQYQKDFGLAKLAVSLRPENFFSLDQSLKNNPEIVKATFQSNPIYSYYIYKDKISENLKRDIGVSVAACKSNLNCLLEVPTETFLNAGFKKDFKTLVSKQQQHIQHSSLNPDEELENFNQTLNNLLEQKQTLILQERLNSKQEDLQNQQPANKEADLTQNSLDFKNIIIQKNSLHLEQEDIENNQE